MFLKEQLGSEKVGSKQILKCKQVILIKKRLLSARWFSKQELNRPCPCIPGVCLWRKVT